MSTSKSTGMNEGVRPGAYNGTSALVAIPSVEMNIRRGNQFSWTWYLPSLAAGATVYAGFVVGPTHKVIIKTRAMATDGGVTYQAYGDSTFTFNPANEIPNINLNGDSAEVSDLKVYELSAGEITDIGTVLPGGIIRSAEGQGNQTEQGVFSDVGIERILRRDQRNVISITNDDSKTNYVVLDITWYEGPVIPGPDNPL